MSLAKEFSKHIISNMFRMLEPTNPDYGMNISNVNFTKYQKFIEEEFAKYSKVEQSETKNPIYQVFKKGDSVPSNIEKISLTEGSELQYLKFGVDCVVEFINGTVNIYPVNTPKNKKYAVIEASFTSTSNGCMIVGAPTNMYGEESEHYKKNIKYIKAIYKAIKEIKNHV